jgi:PAS domain S-box-containing protein
MNIEDLQHASGAMKRTEPVTEHITNPIGVFEKLPVAVYLCDKQGFVIAYNTALVQLTGIVPQIGIDRYMPAVQLHNLTGGVLLPAQTAIVRTIDTGNATEEQLFIQNSAGQQIRVKSASVAEFDAEGAIAQTIHTLTAIAPDVQHEGQQALLAAIVNTSEDAIVSKTLQGIITSWNQSAERLFGYAPSEIIGRHISVLIPPSRLSEEDTIIGRITQGKTVSHFETVRLTKDGREIHISLSVSPVRDSAGNIIGASKIVRDISDRKKAEERQSILASIVDTSDDTILSKTLDGTITSWNKAAERMFGYTAAEAVGRHISMLIPPARLQEEEYIISQIAQSKKVDHFETVRVTKWGNEVPISLSVSPVMDSSGKVIGASKIARDIRFKKNAEQALLNYTQRLETINSIIQVISAELDLNKILQKVTDITTGLTGAEFGAFFYNQVDYRGESFMLYTLSGAPREAFERFGMPRNTAVFHPTFSGQGVVRVDDITQDPRYGKNDPHYGMPNGHLPVVSYLAVPVVSRSGQVIGGLFFGHSKAGMFTEEHESLIVPIAGQAAMGIDNAKLYEEIKSLNEKKDEFIGLASHELKTPLTSITGYLQILDRIMVNESGRKFITKTIHQVKKLSGLVSDLLDVSKIEAGKLQLAKENFDFTAIVEDAVELIQHSSPTHQIEVHPFDGSVQVYGDPQRVEQVVINLLTNAIKYSPTANKVEVRVIAANGEVRLGVTDFGIGIAPEKFTQLFSRFYRVEDLNPNISGLGIGLYISHEIISRHQGKLWVESELGKGSTFWFSLPLQPAE